jgi:alpha-methylacyl-CoA racemase
MKGCTVLDCSLLLPGPFVGRLLRRQGARVLKVENPARPDPARTLEGGWYYPELNQGKERVDLDLEDPAQRPRFAELVREADGLIEAFRPGTRRKLGLDAPTLHALNPRLCILSLVGYPEGDAERDRPGHDLNFAAESGCLSLFHEMPALPLADLFGAYEGALALEAAMAEAARGAPGKRVVVSFTEALREVQGMLVSEYRGTGKAPGPGTTLFSGKYPCYRVYRAQDGRAVAVGAIEEKFWRKFCDLIGRPDLVGGAFAEGAEGEAVASAVQQVLASRSWSHWEPRFAAADCCVSIALGYPEAFGPPGTP